MRNEIGYLFFAELSRLLFIVGTVELLEDKMKIIPSLTFNVS